MDRLGHGFARNGARLRVRAEARTDRLARLEVELTDGTMRKLEHRRPRLMPAEVAYRPGSVHTLGEAALADKYATLTGNTDEAITKE